MEATLTLEYTEKKTAEAIARAVSPDNFKTPVGLEVQTTQEDNRVVTQISCGGKLATFTATLDDLLFSASTAERTVGALKKSTKFLKKRKYANQSRLVFLFSLLS